MSDSIIERIRKLLALAANNPEPKEAERAAEMANRLMLEHSISAERLSAHKGSDDLKNYGRSVFTTGKFAAWEVQLLMAIARANLCDIVKIGRENFDILGHNDNVRVVIEIHEWLRTELHRLARESYARKDSASEYGSMDPHRFHVGFKTGAVLAIHERFQVTRKEMQATDAGSAIVLVESKTKDFIAKVYPALTQTKSSAGRNASGDAKAAGYRAGQSVALKPTKALR